MAVGAEADASTAAPAQAAKGVMINGEEVQGEAQALAHLAMEALVVDPDEVTRDEPAPELDPKTGIPKVLKSYIVMEDPKIYVVPNFVSDAEIEHILKLAEERWVPSTVGRGQYQTNDESKDLKNQSSQNRTSYSCMLETGQTAMVQSIEERLAAIAGLSVDYLERLNLVRYAPGQFFNKHHDGRFRPKTVFLYLNDLPEDDAGETFFPELKLKFRPRKGCAVLWTNTLNGVEDHRMVHLGLPPRTTMKYGVNCFFNDKPLKQMMGDVLYTTVDPDSLAEDDERQPGLLKAYTVWKDPKVVVVPHFLTADQVDFLIAAGTDQPVDYQDLDRIELICANLGGMPVAHMTPIAVSRCDPEMTPMSKSEGRKMLFIFLNDLPRGGGELRFPHLSLQLRPRKGTAVLWSPAGEDGQLDERVQHEGRSPVEGSRFTAICTFHASKVRAAVAKTAAA